MKRLFIIGALVVVALLNLSGSEEYEYQPAFHTVRSGQTVWGIATKYMAQQDRTRDVRELAWEIKTANHLDSYMIHPGQTLEVPLWVRK